MKQSVQLLPLSELRPAGYPLVLHLLQPFHSLLLVTTVQHLMGIALGAIIYAVLRTRGLPAWGATLAAVPTLFDSRQIWLESSILPDTLFTLVLMIAVAILVVRPKPAIWQAVIVGLLVLVSVGAGLWLRWDDAGHPRPRLAWRKLGADRGAHSTRLHASASCTPAVSGRTASRTLSPPSSARW